jgi:hypothetical protein
MVMNREARAMQGRARALLSAVAGRMFLYGQHEHQFKGSHQSQQWAGRDGEVRAGLIETLGPAGQAIADDMKANAETAYSILASIANDEAVKTSDLDDLTKMLDSDAGPIRFKPPNPMATLSTHAYRRLGSLGARSWSGSFGDLLLEYMNISATYGRVHGICQRKGCGALMTSGRGGKKYCSSACTKAQWAYENNKEYYTKNRRDARGISKLSSRRIPKKKGAKH